MPTKAATADQCKTLHQYYPPPDCCICNNKAEVARLTAILVDQLNYIDKLRGELTMLRGVVDAARVFVRDVDAVIQTTKTERRLANKLDELDTTYPR